MCFGGGGSKPIPPPAPAPPAPEALPTPTDIGIARKQEDESLYGTDMPTMRVNRQAPKTPGGTGVRMT